MTATTTTTTSTNRTTVINLGFAEIWIDRFTGCTPQLAITHTAKWEVEIEAGHYTILAALTVPSKDSIKAAAIGAMVGAAGVFCALQSHLL